MANPLVQEHISQLNHLLCFSGVSWWIIDIENEPDRFYCNQTMVDVFSLDPNLEKHSVSLTCPIAGDYNKNVEMKSDLQAKLIFSEYRQLLNQEITEYNNQFPYYNHALDKHFYFKSRARVLALDANGDVALIFGIIEDMTEIEEQRREIELQKSRFKALSEKDAVTKLYNRRYFMTIFKHGFYQAQKEQLSIAVLMIDADNFKHYNDYYGHLKGDECLKGIAACICSVFCRTKDVVARFGGDEFIVFIQAAKADELKHIALTLKDKLSLDGAIQPENKNLPPISLSIGGYISTPSSDESDIDFYIKKADENLYKAKSLGKNTLVLSAPES